jgi:deoxyribodipyrimidine photolyase
MPSRAVVWFRRDLRVADHPALRAALDAADQVVPVFVVDRTLLDGRPSGPNRRAFLHGALRSLARDLEALGGRLLVREGDPVQVVPAVARRFAADSVWCSRDFTPYARRRDTAVERALRADPQGEYIRRWVPELAKLPAPAIFAPWQAAAPDLEAAGVRLGADYPDPVVDHRRARDRALARFQEASARRSAGVHWPWPLASVRLSTISPKPLDPTAPRVLDSPCQRSRVRPSWSYFGRRPV